MSVRTLAPGGAVEETDASLEAHLQMVERAARLFPGARAVGHRPHELEPCREAS